MKQTIFAVIVIVFISGTVMSSETWMISQELDGDFGSISEALESDLLLSGDTLLVYPGIYEENIRVRACRNIQIRSTDGPHSTIIMPTVYTDHRKQYAVMIKGRSTFEGFTVMENPINLSSKGDPELMDLFGNGKPWPHTSTGIYVTGPANITNNIVMGFRVGVCSSCPSGAHGTPSYVRFNEFHSNDIGVSLCETTNVVRDNFVHDNYWLGVLVSHGACGELSNNLIINNGTIDREATSGVLCWQDYDKRPDLQMTPLITNNTIHGNRGPGIRCRYVRGGLCTPVIQHNLITMNTGAGLYCESMSSAFDTTPYPIVHYCYFWNNAQGSTHNVARATGCMEVNPMYEDGFFLNPESPCINAGMLPGTWGTVLDADDLDGKQIDIGFHHPPKSSHPDHYQVIE